MVGKKPPPVILPLGPYWESNKAVLEESFGKREGVRLVFRLSYSRPSNIQNLLFLSSAGRGYRSYKVEHGSPFWESQAVVSARFRILPRGMPPFDDQDHTNPYRALTFGKPRKGKAKTVEETNHYRASSVYEIWHHAIHVTGGRFCELFGRRYQDQQDRLAMMFPGMVANTKTKKSKGPPNAWRHLMYEIRPRQWFSLSHLFSDDVLGGWLDLRQSMDWPLIPDLTPTAEPLPWSWLDLRYDTDTYRAKPTDLSLFGSPATNPFLTGNHAPVSFHETMIRGPSMYYSETNPDMDFVHLCHTETQPTISVDQQQLQMYFATDQQHSAMIELDNELDNENEVEIQNRYEPHPSSSSSHIEEVYPTTNVVPPPTEEEQLAFVDSIFAQSSSSSSTLEPCPKRYKVDPVVELMSGLSKLDIVYNRLREMLPPRPTIG